MPYAPLRVLSRVVAARLDRQVSLSSPPAHDVVAFLRSPQIRGNYYGSCVYFPHLSYSLTKTSLFRTVFSYLPILSMLYYFTIDLTFGVH